MGKGTRVRQQRREQASARTYASVAAAVAAGPAPGSWGVLEGMSLPGPMIRSACSECASSALSWMSAAELIEAVPEHRKAPAREGLDFFGPNAQAWLCRDCDGFGLMP